jgi:hypothetical protein
MSYCIRNKPKSLNFRKWLDQFLEDGGKVHVRETEQEIKATFDSEEEWSKFFARFKPRNEQGTLP